MWIRLLKAVGKDAEGALIDVAETLGKAYIDAGLAEDAGQGPENQLLTKALESLRSEVGGLVDTVTTTITEARKNLPRPNIQATESEDDKRKNHADYLRCVWIAQTSRGTEAGGRAHERLTKVYGCRFIDGTESRDMTENTGSTGGYTTPVFFESAVFMVDAEDQIVRPRARLLPLPAREVEVPALDQYQVPTKGNSAFYGGVQVYRKGENVARTETDPKFSKIKMLANDLTALVKIGRDLIADSTAGLANALLPMLIGGAINWREDWEALVGTKDVASLTSVLVAPCTIAVTRQTGGTITYVDIATMLSRLTPSSRKRAVFVGHPFVIETLLTLQDPGGRYIFIPNWPGAQEGAASVMPMMNLVGRPYLESEKLPALGTKGDLMLCDFERYYLGQREGLEIGISDQFAFDTDEITFRAKLRNDGKPALKKAITLADGAGTNTVSSFVVLN